MKVLIVLCSIVVVIIITVVTIVLTVLRTNTPTKGDEIYRYTNPKSALLVIDVQNDTTNNKAFYGDTTEFVYNVNQVILLAYENKMDVLYIKNYSNPITSFLAGGKYKIGTEGYELSSNLQVVNENIFLKSIGDAFSSTDFENYLISNEINTIYIIGADASACIYSTARGGLNRKYNVNVIKEAIITINTETMDKMLKQYKADGIGIIDLEQFKKAVN